jgi:hypothetical protein
MSVYMRLGGCISSAYINRGVVVGLDTHLSHQDLGLHLHFDAAT